LEKVETCGAADEVVEVSTEATVAGDDVAGAEVAEVTAEATDEVVEVSRVVTAVSDGATEPGVDEAPVNGQ